jgi:hypothetical protein
VFKNIVQILWHPFANATEQPVKGTIQQWKEITASKAPFGSHK